MIEFCESAQLHQIKRAAGSPADFECIKSEIQKGIARFVKIYGVFFVLRVDGQALTVVCAEGKELKRASYVVIELARRLGLNAIDFYTQRPALTRLLKHCNFNLLDTADGGYKVYRMVLNG